MMPLSMGAGSSLQAGGGAAGPSTATSSSGVNNSGWNVSYGSGGIGLGGNTYVMLAVAALGVYLLWKTSRRGR